MTTAVVVRRTLVDSNEYERAVKRLACDFADIFEFLTRFGVNNHIACADGFRRFLGYFFCYVDCHSFFLLFRKNVSKPFHIEIVSFRLKYRKAQCLLLLIRSFHCLVQTPDGLCLVPFLRPISFLERISVFFLGVFLLLDIISNG